MLESQLSLVFLTLNLIQHSLKFKVVPDRKLTLTFLLIQLRQLILKVFQLLRTKFVVINPNSNHLKYVAVFKLTSVSILKDAKVKNNVQMVVIQELGSISHN